MNVTYRLWCWKNRNLGETFKAGQSNCADRFTRHGLRFTSLDNSQSKLVFSLHFNATIYYCILLYFYLIMYSLLTNTVLYLICSVLAGFTVIPYH